MGDVVYQDFKRAHDSEPVRALNVRTPETVERDLALAGFAQAYCKGRKTALMATEYEGEAVRVTLFPYDHHVMGTLRDKGARLQVDVSLPDEEPYHFAIFFEEVGDNLLRQNGFFAPRDKHGAHRLPKLVNESLEAIVRHLIEYEPNIPSALRGPAV